MDARKEEKAKRGKIQDKRDREEVSDRQRRGSMEKRIERTKVEQAVRVPLFLLLDCSPVLLFCYGVGRVYNCVCVCVLPFYPIDRQTDNRQARKKARAQFFSCL